jgi:hypothetical protein
MDTQTIILISVGLVTIGTMIYCILRDDKEDSKNIKKQVRFEEQHEEVFEEDESSNYATIDDGAEESIFDSE